MFRAGLFRKRPALSSSDGRVWASLSAYREAAEESLRSVVQVKGVANKGGLTLFLVARNESDRLPAFVDHYRRLGVEQFVIVDNGSSDATQELLGREPDVELYYTDASFKDNNFGMLWVEGLIQRLAMNRWIVTVDVDELLVYDGCFQFPIHMLIERGIGREKIFAPMLDLYELEPGSLYFDAAPESIRHHAEGTSVVGGLRHRMAVKCESPHSPCLTKYPVVFYDRTTAFLDRHFPLPFKTNRNDCIARLLHTKTIGPFAAKVATAIEENQHWRDCLEYKTYAQWAGFDYRAPCSRPYREPGDLIGQGLMKKINWGSRI